MVVGIVTNCFKVDQLVVVVWLLWGTNREVLPALTLPFPFRNTSSHCVARTVRSGQDALHD